MDGLIQPVVAEVNEVSTDSFRADGFISEMAAADYYKCSLETGKQCHSWLKVDLVLFPAHQKCILYNRKRTGGF